MKKILLTLLISIVVVGVLLGAGYMGYRIGYNNSATGSGGVPAFGRPYHMNPDQMPMHNFSEGRDFGFNQHPMMKPGGFNRMGYNHYSPFASLMHIAILGLFIWLAYWLFAKSGWQITRKMDSASKSDSTK